MLYLVYDAAKYGVPGLMSLKEQFPRHELLLSKEFDSDLAFVAPWIFRIEEEKMEAFQNLTVDSQNLLWFESKVEMLDIIKAFQKIIYNNDPEFAKEYFRVWDIKVLVGELSKPKENPVLDLFKVIDNIYLLNEEMMKMYYLDFWGVLNNKTAQNIIPKSTICHFQPQD